MIFEIPDRVTLGLNYGGQLSEAAVRERSDTAWVGDGTNTPGGRRRRTPFNIPNGIGGPLAGGIWTHAPVTKQEYTTIRQTRWEGGERA